MTESQTHRAMKAAVKRALMDDDYVVTEEPSSPPGERVSWSSYRPDLLGRRLRGGTEEVVLVECETHPNIRRLRAKGHESVILQPRLFERGSVRRILAVPQGKLGSLDMKVRSEWEVWVMGPGSPLETFARSGSHPVGALPPAGAVDPAS